MKKYMAVKNYKKAVKNMSKSRQFYHIKKP